MFLLFFNWPVAGPSWLARARPVFALSLKLNWSHLSSVARLAQAGRAQCDSCCCCHDWQHPMLGVINWPHNYFSFVEKIFVRLKTWEADTDGTFVFSLLVASGGKNMSCGRPMIRLWIIYSIFARIHPLEQLRSQFKAVGLIENEMVRLKGPSARLQFLRCSLARLVAAGGGFQDNQAPLRPTSSLPPADYWHHIQQKTIFTIFTTDCTQERKSQSS